MKVRFSIIAMLAIAALLEGCSSVNPENPVGPVNPDGPEVIPVTDEAISFSAGCKEVTTKAFLQPDDGSFTKDGNELKVYDILTFTSEGSKVFNYINGDILTYDGIRLKWALPTVYPWTRSGSHKFFGWLAKDSEMNLATTDFFNVNVSQGTGNNADVITLDIGEKKITRESPQYDFLYSDIVRRTMTNQGDDHSPVHLEMKHLFTALSIGAENTLKGLDVIVKSVEVRGLKTKKSASIAYGGGSAPAVTYNSASETYSLESNGDVLLEPNQLLNATYPNIMSGEEHKEETEYFMMWPQTETDLNLNDNCVFDSDGILLSGWTEDDPIVFVRYQLEGDDRILESHLPLRNAINSGAIKEMKAGYRYHISVVFTEKSINLVISVLDWDDKSFELDYASGLSGERQALSFNTTESIVSTEDMTVILKQERPAIGEFRVNTPVGANVLIDLDGDWRDFEVVFTQGEVIGVPTTQNTVFEVRPKVQSPDREYRVTLSISLRTLEGKIINADKELGVVSEDFSRRYTIILPEA